MNIFRKIIQGPYLLKLQETIINNNLGQTLTDVKNERGRKERQSN